MLELLLTLILITLFVILLGVMVIVYRFGYTNRLLRWQGELAIWTCNGLDLDSRIPPCPKEYSE